MPARLCAWWLGICLCGTAQAQSELQRFEFQQVRMGVPFKLVLYADDEAIANKAARAAFDRIEELDRSLSDYDPNSELLRMCRNSGPGKPVAVSPELFRVLCCSQQLACETDGAFDVTVGPVVKLWRRARRRKELPDPERLAAARKLVGYQHVRLDACTRQVELRQAGMKLDLGAIAKGYAGDEVLAVLRRHGVTRALIDGGGDIVVGDRPPGRNGWRIDVAALDGGNNSAKHALVLANAAVATSGDAYQFVEIDGVRYSHIVDPETGLGLTVRSSVTVVANSGMQADSLASAVSVLGPQKGIEFIEAVHDAEALVVSVENGAARTRMSSGFRALASLF